MKPVYQHPIGTNLPKHVIEHFAEDVAKQVGLQPGGSLEELVSNTGGKLTYGSTGIEDQKSGSIIARALNDYTIYLSRNTSRQRDRFTIAHELGHLVLHFPKIQSAYPGAFMRATRWVDETDENQKRAEWEANWFAAALLMMKDEFTAAYKSGGLTAIQSKFDVSASAAEIRAKSLGLL